jgi:hypothetical protein
MRYKEKLREIFEEKVCLRLGKAGILIALIILNLICL